MNTVKIKKLILKNFKGIKKLEIDFKKVTNILGENATGKTTIFDSFCWLLFGKDCKDRKDFEIKTLSPTGEALHGLEHSVEAILEINGEEVTLQRIYAEKWTKKKGLADKVFSGHETTYYINQVPAKQKEYNEKVAEILPDSTFKLISNPLYFNNLEWKKQREILLQIIGDIDQENVINHKDSLKPLETLLEGNTTVEDFRKKIKAQIAKYSKDKESIPYRIDECNENIIEEDFSILEGRKKTVENGIASLDKQLLNDGQGNTQKIDLQNKIYELNKELQDESIKDREKADEPLQIIQQDIRDTKSKLQDLDWKLKNKNVDHTHLVQENLRVEENIKAKLEKQDSLRDEFKKEKAKAFEFDESQTCCPHCGRAYETEKIEDLKEKAQNHFEETKKKILASINSNGKRLGSEIEELKQKQAENIEKLSAFETNIEELTSQREEVDIKLKELENAAEEIKNAPTAENPKISELTAKIQKLKTEVATCIAPDNTELLKRKQVLQGDLETINRRLAAKDKNEDLRNRILTLQDEERRLAEEIAKLEGYDFMCEEFIRTKVELLEERINSKFKTVRFKLFKQQINGGIDECCETLINGVPYSNANTASQINSGIEIINTLSEHYKFQVPIFIDNRESVNEILDTESQIINLIVSKDKKLRVEVDE
ncbi:DNA repair exonuclease SbcCD ATPase subunit [Clostridium beijerinckii]|uniref:AAA family ATPase n=1 Tax=Clostridium beijerinckii TaxID=1520 RepID=UPI001494AFB5|nr:AAA family ATPase [Clostridium beijerinckii]NOW85575.1 DNA repair exonuclease SbcCD ATPase subunit [Clostridium beijerinckii]